jgi:hypothetical protein
VTYYSHLTFLRPDGSEITRRAVELLPGGAAPEPVGTTQSAVRERTGKTVIVTAGPASYEFDPASARLLSASNGAVKLITGSRFTIWRPLGPNDVVLLRKPPGRPRSQQIHHRGAEDRKRGQAPDGELSATCLPGTRFKSGRS